MQNFSYKKKEIYIENTMKREAVFQILCSINFSESTQFQASKKDKIIVDKSSNRKITKSNIRDIFFEDKLNKKFSNQNF